MSNDVKSPLSESKATAWTNPSFTERGAADQFYLGGRNPDRAYKLISFNTFQKNSYRDFRGWHPLTKQTRTTEEWQDSSELYGVKGDGFAHVGDLIWAWMPRETYDAHRAVVAEKTRLRTEGVAAAPQRIAKHGGIPLQTEDESTDCRGPMG